MSMTSYSMNAVYTVILGNTLLSRSSSVTSHQILQISRFWYDSECRISYKSGKRRRDCSAFEYDKREREKIYVFFVIY